MNLKRVMLRLQNRIWLTSLCLLACSMVQASTTAAPLHIQQEIPQARLAGQGVYTWFGLKIYDAQLWVGETGYQSGLPAAAKFGLDLHYARDLDGARIAEASVKEIKNIGLGTAQQHSSWLTKMKEIFPDVKAGSRITGVYLPQQGARFYLDGKRLGDVSDPEFGRAFFAIWLDPKTSDKKLRSALLGDAASLTPPSLFIPLQPLQNQ